MKKVALLLFISYICGCTTPSSSSTTSSSIPTRSSSYSQTGIASYYADKYQGRLTANGERFNQSLKTAAHKKLSFGSKVKVTNLQNDRTVIVRINDRGPFVKGRIIDLSSSAFQKIANLRDGLINVKIEVID